MKAQILINSSRVLNISVRHPLDAISTKPRSIAIASTVGAKLRRAVIAPTVGAKPRSVAFRLYCGDVDDTQLSYRLPSAVTANDEKDFEIYPNPSLGKVSIKCKLEEGETANVRIFDALGRLVKLQEIKSGENKISLGSAKFSNGFYNFTVKTSHDRIIVSKILLSR